MRTARYWRRLLGGFTDLAIVAGCCVVARAIPNDVLAAILAFVVVMTYLIVSNRYPGQSLGKWIAGTRVVSLDGRPITLRRSTVRALSEVASTMGLLYVAGWGTAWLVQLGYPEPEGERALGWFVFIAFVTVTTATLAMGVVGVAIPLSNRRRRWIHDWVAGTRVVETSESAGSTVRPGNVASGTAFRPW